MEMDFSGGLFCRLDGEGNGPGFAKTRPAASPWPFVVLCVLRGKALLAALARTPP